MGIGKDAGKLRYPLMLRPCLTRESGQMTIEFVVAFPVLILVALIAVNTILFLSECAEFDRLFREEVCVFATSPAYGQTTEDSVGLVEAALADQIDQPYLEYEVSAQGASGGLTCFEGTLRFTPTLFGAGNLRGAFGMEFPAIEHHQSLTVDVYKPGVLL